MTMGATAVSASASAWPAVVGLARVAAAHPVQETGRAPFAEIAVIGQGSF